MSCGLLCLDAFGTYVFRSRTFNANKPSSTKTEQKSKCGSYGIGNPMATNKRKHGSS